MLHRASVWVFAGLLAVSAASAQEKPKEAPQQYPNRATKTTQGLKSQTTTKPEANNPVKGPSSTDKQFLKDAAIGGAFEIQMGQLAQQNASSQQVKEFGQRMVNDHSKNADLLQGVAQTQHVALPTELDAAHKDQKSQLSSKKGSEFDKDYMALMVQDHEKTIKRFQRETATTHDPTIKKYAESSLPVLQSHLDEARKLAGQLHVAGAGESAGKAGDHGKKRPVKEQKP